MQKSPFRFCFIDAYLIEMRTATFPVSLREKTITLQSVIKCCDDIEIALIF